MDPGEKDQVLKKIGKVTEVISIETRDEVDSRKSLLPLANWLQG